MAAQSESSGTLIPKSRLGPEGEPTEDLLRAARNGDRVAWRRLDRRTRAALSLFMRGRIPKGARRQFDTEDLLQSAYLSAFTELERYEYRGKGSFLSWMTRVIESRLQARLRRATAQRRDARREQPLSESLAQPTSAAAPGTPSEVFSQAEDHARLVEAVSELPEAQREIITATFFDKKPLAQQARERGVNIKTIRRRLDEGMDMLERRLR